MKLKMERDRAREFAHALADALRVQVPALQAWKRLAVARGQLCTDGGGQPEGVEEECEAAEAAVLALGFDPWSGEPIGKATDEGPTGEVGLDSSAELADRSVTTAGIGG